MFEQVAFPFSSETSPWPATLSASSPSPAGSGRWVWAVVIILALLLAGLVWWTLSKKQKVESRKSSQAVENFIGENIRPESVP